jgi:hypothetical protein
VSCVESGRWRYESPGSSDFKLHINSRQMRCVQPPISGILSTSPAEATPLAAAGHADFDRLEPRLPWLPQHRYFDGVRDLAAARRALEEGVVLETRSGICSRGTSGGTRCFRRHGAWRLVRIAAPTAPAAGPTGRAGALHRLPRRPESLAAAGRAAALTRGVRAALRRTSRR